MINNWISEGDYFDTYRSFHPEGKVYTFRVRKAETKEIVRQARLDYALASRQLFSRITDVHHICPTHAFSDHSGVRVTITIEKLKEGPGTFRALPYIEEDLNYAASTRHLITQEVLDQSNMRRADKISETELNNLIFQLTLKMNNNEATEKEHEELALKISVQKTKAEIIELGSCLPNHKVLDYVIQQIGRATKKERKKLSNNKVTELN